MNKKILLIINNFGIGGAERVALEEVRELKRLGADVMVITLKPEPPKSFRNMVEAELGQGKMQHVHFRHLLHLGAWLELISAIRHFKPHLVITQLWFANTIGRAASALAGAPRIISFEQNVYDKVKTRKMFLIDWLIQPLSFKVIAVSKAVKRSLVRRGISERRIDVIYNSIDLSKLSIAQGGDNTREIYGIPPDSFLYLFVGRLIYQKAVDVLIDAFGNIKDQGSRLLIIGQGKDQRALEERAKKSEAADRIVFGGVSNDAPKLLAAADCFVLPSRYEGMPLVLVEALSAGKPIIVSDFEAAEEAVTHGVNGLIVPREDPQALAGAMTRIREDEELKTRLADGARRSAERFSITNHAHAILRYAQAK